MTVLETLLIAVGAFCLVVGVLLMQRAQRHLSKLAEAAFSDPGCFVEVDCRSCGQFNRVPAGRLRDQPKCGRCKRRLLPGSRLVLCRVSPMENSLRTELNAVWSDEDRLWRQIADHVTLKGQASDGLEAKLVAMEKGKKEDWERYQRIAADLENLRKRQRRVLVDARVDGEVTVLKEVLPVVDSLERALEYAAQQAETSSLVEGGQLVLRQFLAALGRLEVSLIEATGQPFDPKFHEAVSQVESSEPPGTVVQAIQRGYRVNDRLLRPALVAVAKPLTQRDAP